MDEQFVIQSRAKHVNRQVWEIYKVKINVWRVPKDVKNLSNRAYNNVKGLITASVGEGMWKWVLMLWVEI